MRESTIRVPGPSPQDQTRPSRVKGESRGYLVRVPIPPPPSHPLPSHPSLPWTEVDLVRSGYLSPCDHAVVARCRLWIFKRREMKIIFTHVRPHRGYKTRCMQTFITIYLSLHNWSIMLTARLCRNCISVFSGRWDNIWNFALQFLRSGRIYIFDHNDFIGKITILSSAFYILICTKFAVNVINLNCKLKCYMYVQFLWKNKGQLKGCFLKIFSSLRLNLRLKFSFFFGLLFYGSIFVAKNAKQETRQSFCMTAGGVPSAA